VGGHPSRLENGKSSNPFRECFPYKILYAVSDGLPWYIDIANYLVTEMFPKDLSGA